MAMVRYFTSTRPAIGIRIDEAGYRYPRHCFGRIIGYRPGNSQFCSEVEIGYTNLPFKCPNLPLKHGSPSREIAQTFR
jgi:hypothetical protein